MGRLRWNELTASFTPFSCWILEARVCAAATTSGERRNLMALERVVTLRDFCSIGAGPAPAAATMLPQNG